jgi:paraquat-inducible protein A
VSELDRLIACHECAAIYRRTEIPANASALCTRCDAVLYKHIPDTLNRSLALYLGALMLWLIANLFPFLGLKVGAVYHENLLITGGWALYKYGMGELGLVVFLTSIVFPFLTITGTVYLLLSLRINLVPPQAGRVFQMIKLLEPWSLISVFMLGTLIAIVKLQDMATVVPGMSLAAFTLLLIVFAWARSNFDAEAMWQKIETLRDSPTAVTDLEEDDTVLHCHVCDGLQVSGHHCHRCGSAIHHRIANSIQQTWAFLFAAVLMLIPANIYPVMTVQKLGKGQPDTIISGIIHLIEGGLWGLGLIVLFASIIVPVAKLLSLSFLLYSVQTNSDWKPKDRTLLYRVTEVVGSWSMVDVFLVGLLAGLVSLGLLANVTPGIGASFFGAAVILTMLAAHQFDPRLIWDNAGGTALSGANRTALSGANKTAMSGANKTALSGANKTALSGVNEIL